MTLRSPIASLRAPTGRNSKVAAVKAAWTPAFLAVAWCATSLAAGTEPQALSNQQLQAKIEYCQDCHGPAGQGISGGYLTIPRIAGQTPEYIEKQLRAFNDNTRDKNGDVGITSAHRLDVAMEAALAVHFSALDPVPVEGGSLQLVPIGKRLYDEGAPESNVPACSGCHGPQARGKNEIPRLAGQLDLYTEKELTGWSTLRGQNPVGAGTAGPMKQVAHSLSSSQIAAIAAYLSHLTP